MSDTGGAPSGAGPSSEWDGRDFGLVVKLGPPAGYPPSSNPDAVEETVPGWRDAKTWAREYLGRRDAYLAFLAARPAPPILKAPFYELPRAAAGLPVHEGILHAGLDYIEERRDCSDFLVHAYLRLLLTDGLSRGVPPGLLERSEAVLLAFKYWPDEPGSDSLCTWTENHQVLYATAALILGTAWPDKTFCNSGRRGREVAELARPRLLRWLDLRFKTGFSEWLSNVYYDEDLAALLSLVDFADDGIASRARSVADLVFLDLALNSCRGAFCASHGRSYAEQKKHAGLEATSDTCKLAFGAGCWSAHDNMSAVCLALSTHYRPPAAVAAIASALGQPGDAGGGGAVIRQRMGIKVEEAGRWGLGYDSLEDGMAFLSLEAYNHPRTIDLTFKLFDAYGWWDNAYFAPFRRLRGAIGLARRLHLLPFMARAFGRDVNRNSREEVNLYTFRTADYSLSAAQDWHHRRGGDQHSVWQACLGPEATCFTTHPGSPGDRSPGYWTGSGCLPRVAQHRNLLFALYDITTRPGLYHTDHLVFTHAWLPEEAFDEVAVQGRWFFARKAEAYLGLWCDRRTEWRHEGGGPGPRNEVIARGSHSSWLCRLGRAAEDGGFADFRSAISQAGVITRRDRILFDDPSLGRVEFGRTGPLLVEGRPQPLRDYPRYDSPWASAGFPATEVRLSCLGEKLTIGPSFSS